MLRHLASLVSGIAEHVQTDGHVGDLDDTLASLDNLDQALERLSELILKPGSALDDGGL